MENQTWTNSWYNNIRVIEKPYEEKGNLKIWIDFDWRYIIITETNWFKWWILDIINWSSITSKSLSEKGQEIINFVTTQVWDISTPVEKTSYRFVDWWETVTNKIEVL